MFVMCGLLCRLKQRYLTKFRMVSDPPGAPEVKFYYGDAFLASSPLQFYLEETDFEPMYKIRATVTDALLSGYNKLLEAKLFKAIAPEFVICAPFQWHVMRTNGNDLQTLFGLVQEWYTQDARGMVFTKNRDLVDVVVIPIVFE